MSAELDAIGLPSSSERGLLVRVTLLEVQTLPIGTARQ